MSGQLRKENVTIVICEDDPKEVNLQQFAELNNLLGQGFVVEGSEATSKIMVFILTRLSKVDQGEVSPFQPGKKK